MGRWAYMHTFTSELPFATFSERVLILNVSHEKDLIFMRMNIQVTYFHTNNFTQGRVLPQGQK